MMEMVDDDCTEETLLPQIQDPDDYGGGKTTPLLFGNYEPSVQILKPSRRTSPERQPTDNAGFFSFATFSWAIFRNKLHVNSLNISPLDEAAGSTDRLDVSSLNMLPLDEAEGSTDRLDVNSLNMLPLDEAEGSTDRRNLVRAIPRFQRTRLMLSVIVRVLAVATAILGPGVLVYLLLKYVEDPSK
ncbi:ATP-binding cassette sub-family C member 12-like isoform X2 [Stigmatopora argus]